MRPRILTTALITTLLSAGLTTPAARAAAQDAGVSIASFEGGYIDLRDGWGEATACTTDNVTTECFRTEAELDKFVIDTASLTNLTIDDLIILSTCSTSLKLYANTSYGGATLALSTRGTFLNLSSWGFDNITSSYKIGACSATFYDGANGGAPTYPGNTSAGASATSMLSGWDNRVGSVYIS